MYVRRNSPNRSYFFLLTAQSALLAVFPPIAHLLSTASYDFVSKRWSARDVIVIDSVMARFRMLRFGIVAVRRREREPG